MATARSDTILANVMGVGGGVECGEAGDDKRGQQPGDHAGGHEHDHRQGQDRRDGPERVILTAVGKVVDEDGNECGREDSHQDDVVEHVGSRVGQVEEGVGQGALSQCPRQGHDAQEAGEPRDPGPQCDVAGRGRERTGGAFRPGSADDGFHAHPACGRRRRALRQVRTHQTKRTSPASTVSSPDPHDGDGGGAHGEARSGRW